MTHGPKARVPFRRRRDEKTDYRRRLKLLRSGLPRAVVRKTLRNTIVQIVSYDQTGDRVIASAVGTELYKYGWNHNAGNISAAYLTGFLAGKRAKAKGVDVVVLDIGLSTPTRGSKVFASLKGLLDAGLDIPHDEGVLPSQERMEGKHISEDVMRSFREVKAKLEAK